MRILKALLWIAALIGCAVVGYGLSKFIVPNPDVRGGFLYISPLLAMGVAAILGPWQNLRNSCRRGDLPPAKLRERIKAMAEKLGMEPPEAVVDSHEDTVIAEAISFSCDQFCIYLKQWNKLNAGEQDFALARKLAEYNFKGPSHLWATRTLVTMACSTLACVNLWFILPLHSGNLLFTLWRIRWFIRRRTLELDAMAVRATGDLKSARGVIERSRYDFYISREERLHHLNEVFG